MLRVLENEKGFIVAIGVCWLSIVLFFGGAIYTINEAKTRTINRFLDTQFLKDVSDNGAKKCFAKLLEDDELKLKIRANSKEIKIFDGCIDDVQCEVYAREQNERIILLSIALKDDMRARSILWLKKTVDNTYTVDYWEH